MESTLSALYASPKHRSPYNAIHIYQHSERFYVRLFALLEYSTIFFLFILFYFWEMFVLKYFNDKFFSRNTFSFSVILQEAIFCIYCTVATSHHLPFYSFICCHSCMHLIQIINFFLQFHFSFGKNRKTGAIELCWMRQSNPRSIHIACSARFRMACGLLEVPWMSTIPGRTMHMLCKRWTNLL